MHPLGAFDPDVWVISRLGNNFSGSVKKVFVMKRNSGRNLGSVRSFNGKNAGALRTTFPSDQRGRPRDVRRNFQGGDKATLELFVCNESLPFRAELEIRQCGAIEIGAIEIGANKMGTTEIGANEIGATEIGAAEIGSRQIGGAKVDETEVGAMEVGANEIGAAEIGVPKIGVPEIGFAENSATEIGALKIGALKIRASKIGIDK
jgi:hypothetical protein